MSTGEEEEGADEDDDDEEEEEEEEEEVEPLRTSELDPAERPLLPRAAEDILIDQYIYIYICVCICI